MKLTGLEKLHASMKILGVDMQKFRIKTGSAEFECLFSTRGVPFSLALTSRGADPRYFLFDIKRGYFVPDYLGDQYNDLCDVLFVNGRSGEPLIPKTWLAELNAAIPSRAQIKQVPDAADIVRLRQDIEERDRPYFDTWVCWNDERRPSEENQKKTLQIIGEAALEFSSKNNASSKWSAYPTGRDWRA